MNQSDLTFGIKEESLDKIRSAISERFGMSFELRFSDYFGGDYFLSKHEGQEIRIQQNRDGDELAESGFPEQNILILVDGTKSPIAWKEWVLSLNGVIVREQSY